MTYHTLTSESGGDELSRVEEMQKICRLLEEFLEEMTSTEKQFIEGMWDCDECSTKQLFWARDIKDKYL